MKRILSILLSVALVCLLAACGAPAQQGGDAPQADAVSAEVEDFGVFVVEKPFSRPMLFQSLRLVLASRRRMLGLQRENVRLNEKLEELRLVSRAKGALMRVLGMTEPQAHHYIEKQAMDLRATRREVARRILGACDE